VVVAKVEVMEEMVEEEEVEGYGCTSDGLCMVAPLVMEFMGFFSRQPLPVWSRVYKPYIIQASTCASSHPCALSTDGHSPYCRLRLPMLRPPRAKWRRLG
jgi:hypothetical protein